MKGEGWSPLNMCKSHRQDQQTNTGVTMYHLLLFSSTPPFSTVARALFLVCKVRRPDQSLGLVCSGCLQIKCGDGTKCGRLAPQWESHLNNLSGPIVETLLHHDLTLTAAAAKVKFQCLANGCNQNRPKSLTEEIDWDVWFNRWLHAFQY